MTILLSAGDKDTNQAWYKELIKASKMPVSVYPDVDNRDAIRYALIWQHPKGDLCNYPALSAILSLGAGVEHITDDSDLPPVPIVRMADPVMSHAMASYCLYWAISYQRRFDLYAIQQRQGLWCEHSCPDNASFEVGVLGLGVIGSIVAKAMVNHGYKVSGWSKNQKNITSVTTYAGAGELDRFLSHTNLLINCLPLTRSTRGLMDADFFRCMKHGSFVINIGRGSTIVQKHLLEALESGQIEAVTLDVFDQEPLPAKSALWKNPGVHITPHISGPTFVRSAVPIVLANIARMERGEQPFPLYSPDNGY